MLRLFPFLAFLSILSLVACQPKPSNDTTWLIGKIDNPKQDYVIIKHNRHVLDTVLIDNTNFFRYRFKNPVTEGMYNFEHGESFPFYIAQGDSLLFLANTLDFEASLYFTHDHALENNLLIKLNQRLNSDGFFWSELHEYTPKEFIEVLKKREDENLRLLNDFKKKNPNATERFLRIAKGVIEQDKLLNKERYIQIHRLRSFDAKVIPEDFYNHRKKISFQKDTMEVYYPYYRLVHAYIDNLALESFNQKNQFNPSDFELNKHKLNLIDSIVDNQGIKNCLLYSSTRSFLLYSKDKSEEDEFLNLHNELSTCPLSKNNLIDLRTYTAQIKPGNKAPDIQLLTYDNTEVNLLDIIRQPTVLFFWSKKDIQHQKIIHTRAKELHAKFPEYNFIGINTDNHFKRWRSEIDKLGYSKENEFQLYNPKIAEKQLVITSYNKVLILDSNGIIRNGHTNIYHRTIENELLQYLN